jgi:hypothetical protein
MTEILGVAGVQELQELQELQNEKESGPDFLRRYFQRSQKSLYKPGTIADDSRDTYLWGSVVA